MKRQPSKYLQSKSKARYGIPEHWPLGLKEILMERIQFEDRIQHSNTTVTFPKEVMQFEYNTKPSPIARNWLLKVLMP